MKVRTKLLGVLSTAAMMLALPTMAFGADNVTIETPTAGDTTLTISYTDGKTTDDYNLQINGKSVLKGKLSKSGNQTITLELTDALEEDDQIVLLVTDGGTFVPTKATVQAKLEEKQPLKMTADKENIEVSADASINLSFDKAYVPNAKDMVQITRYNASGGVVSSYYNALPDTNSGSVKIALNNSDATAYYIIRFIAGDGSASTVPAVRVNVGTPQKPDDGNKGDEGSSGSGSGTTNPGGNYTTTMTEEQKAQVAAAKSMIFAYPSNSIALGESVTPTVTLVAADGSKSVYTGPLVFSYSGNAIVEGSFESMGRFSVASDPSFIGSKIQVTAMLGSFSQTVELTVQANDKSLMLTPNAGEAGKNQSIAFQIGDGQGNRLRMLWTPTVARVVATPKDGSGATIIGTVTDMSNITIGGNGTLVLSSNKATVADVYIIFRDGEGRLFETAHSTFTFGDNGEGSKPPAKGDTNVKLYIGKLDYTVNDDKKTSDSAPVILNNRTFVPFRLLAEVFGAEVKWDDKNQTITTTLDNTTIVMKIGSKTYTINGKEGTMDVAPYINSANRTMVPLRFLAEGLDCDITPNYAANGTTESVDFSR